MSSGHRPQRRPGAAALAVAALLISTLIAAGVSRANLSGTFSVYLPLITQAAGPSSTEPIPVPPPPTTDTAARSGPWSNPATWGGRVPPDGAVVRIPSGITVRLDTATARLSGLDIAGTLVFDDQDVALSSNFVMVHGTLQAGTEAAPFTSQAVITLTGPATPNSIMGMGTKFLGAMHGGIIRLHGASRAKLSWTKLAATAGAGATSFTLAQAPGWSPGDEIIVAPTGMDPAQAEKVTVTAVSGATVSFTPALKFEHFGELQTFAGRTLDARASVGLLTRNIVITSDGVDPLATISERRFGGHVMVMETARAYIEGVEFRRLGQEGRLGRYAFHWHLAGDVRGQYVRNSSINTTFTRGIVVHGSSGALVEGNVGYESHSHMFIFAEDGSEVNNIFRGNLGVLVRRLPTERRIAVFDEDDTRRQRDRIQDEHRPSTFWGLNLYNTLEGNVAAGSENGSGFFYGRGGSEQIGAFGFRNNTAHSHFSPTGGNDRYPPLTHGYGLFITDIHWSGQPPVAFEGFTAFKNSIAGIWIDDVNHTVRGAMLADNASGVIISLSTVEDSVIVGRSANTNGETTELGDGFRSVGINTATQQGAEKGPTVRNVTLINLADAGFGMRNPDLLPTSSFSGITLVNTPRAIFLPQDDMSGGFRDLDGSLSGAGEARVVVGKRPLQAGSGCTLRTDWNAYLCPETNRVVGFYVDLLEDNGAESWQPITVRRDDGVSGQMGRDPDARGGMVLAYRTYRLSLANGFSASRYMLSTFEDEAAATPDEWLIVGLPLAGEALYAYFDDPAERDWQPNLAAPLTSAPNLAALAAGPGGQFFHDRAARVVYVKLVGAAEPTPVFVCAEADCAP